MKLSSCSSDSSVSSDGCEFSEFSISSTDDGAKVKKSVRKLLMESDERVMLVWCGVSQATPFHQERKADRWNEGVRRRE